jgi:cephalosporin hydroxylase
MMTDKLCDETAPHADMATFTTNTYSVLGVYQPESAIKFYHDIPERTITFKPNGVIEVGEAWGSDMDYASRAFLEGLVKNFPALIVGRDAYIQNLEAEIDRLEGFWGIPSLSRTVCIVLYVMGLLILLVNYLTTQQ